MDLERRKFLKLGLAVSAGVAASGALGVLAQNYSGRHVSRTTSNFNRFVDTTCRVCPAACGIRAFLDSHDALVTLQGVPDHPVNHGKICAKGLSAINFHYHPERLMVPMVSEGDRAERFAPIDYSQAVTKAAELINLARSKSAVFLVDTEDDDQELYVGLLEKLGVTYYMISRPVAARKHRRIVDFMAFGHPMVGPDYDGTRLILVFGANPFAGGVNYIAEAKAIIDARVEGNAKMFVFDPICTNTAGRADKWMPITPNTDYIAALFLLKAVGAKVNEKTKSILDDLSPEKACALTGLTPEDFELIADAIRHADKITVVVGDGIYQQKVPEATRAALALLEKAGGGSGFVGKAENPDPKQICALPDQIRQIYQEISYQNRPVFLMTRKSNPFYEMGNEALESALRDKNRVVGHLSICSFVNETNRYADLVIPEKLPLEDWGLATVTWQAGVKTFSLQQPAVMAPPDIASGADTIFQVAKLLGAGDFVTQFGPDQQERVARQVKAAGGEFESAKSRNWFTQADDQTAPAKPDVKQEVLCDLDVAQRDILQIANSDDLTLMIHNTNVMDTNLAASKWLSEITHENPLRINEKDAVRLGVSQGQAVSLEAGEMSIRVSVDICQSVRPGVASIANGMGHDHYGKIAAGQYWRTEKDPDAWLIWWGQYGNGTNPNDLSGGVAVGVKVVKA